jgi:hypothetical protein
VINDKQKMDAGVLKQTEGTGKRARQQRECVRDRAQLEERDSVGNKIDH